MLPAAAASQLSEMFKGRLTKEVPATTWCNEADSTGLTATRRFQLRRICNR